MRRDLITEFMLKKNAWCLLIACVEGGRGHMFGGGGGGRVVRVCVQETEAQTR